MPSYFLGAWTLNMLGVGAWAPRRSHFDSELSRGSSPSPFAL